jgi:hypothetical protein
MRVGRVSRDFSTALVLLCLTLVALVSPAVPAEAQSARDVRLSVTVVDQTNLVLPSATVRITGEEDATRAKTFEPTPTTAQGIATFTGLVAGRYTIQAEFPGFDTGVLTGVRVRVGDNRQTLVLKIQRLQDSITVGQDAQDAASDRRGPAFGTALTREQIDALSDDPDEMKKQIQDVAAHFSSTSSRNPVWASSAAASRPGCEAARSAAAARLRRRKARSRFKATT